MNTLAYSALIFSLMTGCSPTVTVLGDDADSGGAAGGAGGSSAGSSSSSSSTGSSLGSGTTGVAGGSPGAACGGASGATCLPNEWCDHPDDACGATLTGGIPGLQGVCKPRPEGCYQNAIPTCGCDDRVYGNACMAEAAGVDVSTNNWCGGDDEFSELIRCGTIFCDRSAGEYCREIEYDVVGKANDASCHQAPPSCNGIPDCECLVDEPCNDECVHDYGPSLFCAAE